MNKGGKSLVVIRNFYFITAKLQRPPPAYAKAIAEAQAQQVFRNQSL
jgi:hypothetical protein